QGLLHRMMTAELELLKENSYEMLLNARGYNVYYQSPTHSIVGKLIEGLKERQWRYAGSYSHIFLLNTLNKLYQQTRGEFAVFSNRRAWYEFQLSAAYENLSPPKSASKELIPFEGGSEDPRRKALRSRRDLIHGNSKFRR